jgi:NADH:ubiquinone oxidoreductase subunit F (NADH-binding)/(2Fe-2S) ferredoxin
MKVTNEKDLKALGTQAGKKMSEAALRIQVGTSTCGLSRRADLLKKALEAEVKKQGLAADIVEVGCNGMCYQEPIVDVIQKGRPKITYGAVTADKAAALVKAIKSGSVLKEHALFRTDAEENVIAGESIPYGTDEAPQPLKELPERGSYPFYQKQQKIALRNAGLIDPNCIDEYIAFGGYSALAAALAMPAMQVIQEVITSGLRGRGGAGFPTGIKWKTCSEAAGEVKYVVANGSEGDPDIGMHRSMMEGDPHAVLEGLIIAAYAVGASKGFIYVSTHYPAALAKIREAVRQAYDYGLLGEAVLGSTFSFDVIIDEGSGGYVCGEETALITTLEGRYGEPRPRPPFPAQKGLWGQPTVVNNLETLAMVPAIIARGGKWFSGIGTTGNAGTKVLSLNGSITRPCLVEVPLGTTLEEIIAIGGGVSAGKKLKAVTIGGPSGSVLPAQSVKLPLTYDDLNKAGAILGAGFTVIDDSVNMADLALYFLNFFKEETCGKCTTCREGVKKMCELVGELCQGQGRQGHIDLLKQMSQPMIDGSLCALGKTVPVVITSTLKHFAADYSHYIKG